MGELEESETSETIVVLIRGINTAYVSHAYIEFDDFDESLSRQKGRMKIAEFEFAPMLHIRSEGIEVKLQEKADNQALPQLAAMSPEARAAALAAMSSSDRAVVLAGMTADERAVALAAMSPRDRAAALAEMKALDDNLNRACINKIAVSIGMPTSAAIPSEYKDTRYRYQHTLGKSEHPAVREDPKISTMIVVQQLEVLVDLDSVHRFYKIQHTWDKRAEDTKKRIDREVQAQTNRSRRTIQNESKPKPPKINYPLTSSMILCTMAIQHSRFTVKWPSKDEISVAARHADRHAWNLVATRMQLEVLNWTGESDVEKETHAALLTVNEMSLDSNTETLLVEAHLSDPHVHQANVCLVLHGLESKVRRKVKMMLNQYTINMNSCDDYGGSEQDVLLNLKGSNSEMVLLHNLMKSKEWEENEGSKAGYEDSILSLGRLQIVTDPLLLERAHKFKEKVCMCGCAIGHSSLLWGLGYQTDGSEAYSA